MKRILQDKLITNVFHKLLISQKVRPLSLFYVERSMFFEILLLIIAEVGDSKGLCS